MTVLYHFLSVNTNSKIHFVFYTSATPTKNLHKKTIEKKFLKKITDFCDISSDKIEVSIMFAADIKKEIEDIDSEEKIVEKADILIDDKDNYLVYDDFRAAIVNVSAFSIHQLYAKYQRNLLSFNLRYYIKGGKNEKRVDNSILETIDNSPADFWLKNNGITIICDSFEIDGRFLKPRNFSIVNGGQTTYQLYKSDSICKEHDFWLPCKIIKIAGETEDEKKNFILEIAEATNSQKPINEEDLKANSEEQKRFGIAMEKVGVFYQRKRGESIPSKYRAVYRHTKPAEVGKLCLAAIFQKPCKSRANPKTYLDEKYYNVIFNGNQEQIAVICRELIYIEYYFEKIFRPKFKEDNDAKPNSANRIKFATLAERICIAFTALAARYYKGNISESDLATLTDKNSDSNAVYKILSNLGEMKALLPIRLYTDAEFDETLNKPYNTALDKLFTAIINEGTKFYSHECRSNPTLKLTNLIKTDSFYYEILKDYWEDLEPRINEAFNKA